MWLCGKLKRKFGSISHLDNVDVVDTIDIVDIVTP